MSPHFCCFLVRLLGDDTLSSSAREYHCYLFSFILTLLMLPCACSAQSHVDAVISTGQWNVLQNSVEPSLRIRNVTGGQNHPFGGHVTWDSVAVFCSGEWDRGLR